ncbi:MAG: M23 family metallopeptidase [Bacteroidetes bacterium]|nr:MAG: M23 family metallopeptidase [Bacteroidota bacterium]
MKISRKQIYWGIGITAGLVTLGIFVHKHRKRIREVAEEAAEKAQNWLRPVLGKITSKFGFRTDPKTGAANVFHNGIDLAIPIGTQIKSPMPGIVDAITTGGIGGNQVIIKHNNGYKTGYSHLTKALVKKGDKVKQGDVIALSGNTGKSTGPHLHLTLTDPSGAKVDPQKMIYSEVV